MHSRDTPPHLNNILNFELADLKASKSLEDIRGSIDDIPEEVRIINFESEEIPRLFSLHHCVELEAKIQIMKAIKYGYDYLKRLTLKLSFKLTCSHLKQPLLVEALEAMEKTIKEFRVISFNGDIISAAPRPDNIAQMLKLLVKLRRDYQYKFVGDGLAIPVPPVWGKDNNPQQWWSINEVLFTLPS